MANTYIPMGVLLQLQLAVHCGSSLKIAVCEPNIAGGE